METTSNAKLGTMKRDSKKANIFQLVKNLQLWNFGGVSYSLRQDSWPGMEEVVALHRTKGLTGMAATRTCCVPMPHLFALLSPNPELPFLYLSQYWNPFAPRSSFCPCFLWILSSHLTGIFQVDTEVPFPLGKDSTKICIPHFHSSQCLDLVHERGFSFSFRCLLDFEWASALYIDSLVSAIRWEIMAWFNSTRLFRFPKFMLTNLNQCFQGVILVSWPLPRGQ